MSTLFEQLVVADNYARGRSDLPAKVSRMNGLCLHRFFMEWQDGGKARANISRVLPLAGKIVLRP